MHERTMFGRRVIYTDVAEITDSNVVDVINDVMDTHILNRSEIDYLWKYCKGEQPILHRNKTVRPEICNRIVENRANEIVSFKVGYLCGEPIQYIGRSNEKSVIDGITQLNEMMLCENKQSLDRDVVEWQMICGTAYRLVLPSKREDETPFNIYTLDPRDTFIIYSSDIGNEPLLGVKYHTDKLGIRTYTVYSDKMFWKIVDGKIVKTQPHSLGTIPIFEYPANNSRLGAFEIVLPLLDELNNIASNRMDGIEQFIQSFIKFVNCDMTKEEFKEFLELGAIKVKSDGTVNSDVDIVTSELNQSHTQITKEDVYQSILTICGMPSMSDGSTSDSSNNGAVILKNGWQGAETRAKDSELMFKKSENKILKLILKICKESIGTPDELANLQLKDISIKFTRRNYEAIQSKSQVLVSLLGCDKVHPLIAYESSGMFVDPESAYTMGMEYYEENKQDLSEKLVDKGVNPTNAESGKDLKTENGAE